MTIYALSLPALIGVGALAVDVGHMMVSRNVMQNAADAAARAGTVVLATGGSQGDATTAATNIANQNMAGAPALSGAASVVTFPTATSVQVTINHNLPLFLAPVIGVNTAAVRTVAAAQTAAISSVPNGSLVPLAIYCNNSNGCTGALSVGQVLTARRYCGNYFADGPSGNGCGSDIANGEIFSVGITFDNNNSNSQFRSDVRDGYAGTVAMGQLARALPGNRNGWKSGMIDRLAEGRNEVVLPVIREASSSSGNYNIVIVDFVKARISSFSDSGNTDQMSFEIIQDVVSTTDFDESGQGLGINSVAGVRMSL